jgi:hypothetical protein
MDTLVDEAERGGVGDRARGRPSAHLAAVARHEATRPSMASIDPDAQVQWFERTPPLTTAPATRAAFDDDLDVDVDLTFDARLEVSLDASLDAAPCDSDDAELDVPTCVWRRSRSIWTSED